MNRLGKTIAAIIVLLGIGLAAIVRINPAIVRSFVPAPPPAPPAPAVLVMPSGLAIPVAGVIPSALRDSFDDPRGEGGVRGHHALDIPAAIGTPVLSASDGTVEKLFDSKDGGHTVYVRSPDGRFVYYYAHLDGYQPALREGALLMRGQQIATVGATGDADPAAPHLHFEIKRMGRDEKWYEGEDINPYPLLAGNAGRR